MGARTVRANQRDLVYVHSLKEQAENVLRAWLGMSKYSMVLAAVWLLLLSLALMSCFYGMDMKETAG